MNAIGLADLHENCQTPFKKSKHHALTQREKQRNRVLARKRILIEHIFRKLKVFRILSKRYCNRRKRFALRFNLIAAIYKPRTPLTLTFARGLINFCDIFHNKESDNY
ncbi:MAG: transposase family protein [Anaerolineales bacterium]|nr:transposase family protein [Anaerolineales bacterium]